MPPLHTCLDVLTRLNACTSACVHLCKAAPARAKNKNITHESGSGNVCICSMKSGRAMRECALCVCFVRRCPIMCECA